ncbi:MAG TPA: ABC transporter permease [Beijerinckiaceae bacterium]|jgi:peptide/nickel transport system permease protein
MSAAHSSATLGRARPSSWPFWLGFAARRALRLTVLVGAVALAAFLLAKASPVDPIEGYLGQASARVSAEQRALIAAYWGFDQPALMQLMRWAGNLLAGDLGFSFIYNAPVAEVIAERARASFALMFAGWLLSGIIGFALGVLAGGFEDSWGDRIIRTYAYLLASTPTFWLGMLLLIVFAIALGWAPVCCATPIGVLQQDVTWADRLHHLVLPVAALALFGIAQITLHTRAKMIDIMRSDFALYAFAQGASRLEVACRHGARNALLPALTIQFAAIGELFGGSILAEQVFAYPGLGKATVEAGIRGDVPLLLAISIIATLIVGLGNTIADALYFIADPRLRARAVQS